MTDVAVPQNGTLPAAASGADETNTDRIMRELALLQLCLARVTEQVVALVELANDLDGQITFVDEEATRVEAPTDTRVAMDASADVGAAISRHARLIQQRVDTATHLTELGRDGMRPALAVQDEMRAVGAGPKIHATARSN